MKFSGKIKWKNGIHNVIKGLEFCQILMPHSYPELARGYSLLRTGTESDNKVPELDRNCLS